MVVVALRCGFVSRAAVTEFVPLEDARLFEQPHRPIDRRDGDVRIDGRRAGVERLDVGMVFALAEHAGDNLALLGDPQALVSAESFDVDLAGHGLKVSMVERLVKGIVSSLRETKQSSATILDCFVACAPRNGVICFPASACAWCRARSTWRACAAV